MPTKVVQKQQQEYTAFAGRISKYSKDRLAILIPKDIIPNIEQYRGMQLKITVEPIN